VAPNGWSDRLYRLRFNGGVWVEIPLSLTWAVRGEVNYAQRGYRDLPNFGNANYLELPLLFSHEVAYHWRVYGGPYLAVYLNGYTESDGIRNPPTRSHIVSGLMLGTTYALSNRFAADLRYQRDWANLSSSPYSQVYHSFQLGLNYTIGRKL
ncbi:MAG: PorT family protein, partial [Bacteroidetes bacterium]|nr:PorT family protein [Fibrella sp.]